MTTLHINKKLIARIEQRYKLLKLLTKLSQINVPESYQHFCESLKQEAESLLNDLNSSKENMKPALQYFKASLPNNTKLTTSDQKEALEGEKSRFTDCLVEGPFETCRNHFVLLISAFDVQFIVKENRLIVEKLSKSQYDEIKNDNQTKFLYFKIMCSHNTKKLSLEEAKSFLTMWQIKKESTFGYLGTLYGPNLENDPKTEPHYYLILQIKRVDYKLAFDSFMMDDNIICSAVSCDFSLKKTLEIP